MKKIILIFVILLSFLFLVIGCNSEKKEVKKQDNNEVQDIEILEDYSSRPAASDVKPKEFASVKRASILLIEEGLNELHGLFLEDEYNIEAVEKKVRFLLEEIGYCMALNPLPEEAIKDDYINSPQRDLWESNYNSFHSVALDVWQDSLGALQNNISDIDGWPKKLDSPLNPAEYMENMILFFVELKDRAIIGLAE